MLSLLSNPSHGNLSSFVPYNGNGAASAEVIYTPATNFTGTDSFTFKASDGLSDSHSSNGIVTINVAQHAPIAFNQSLIVSHDKPVDINLIASDQDNDPLTYFLLSNPLHGNLTSFNQTSGKVTYMPDKQYVGIDSFRFKVNDGSIDSVNNGIITINVTNSAPLVYNQTVKTHPNTPVSITLGGNENDNDRMTFSILSNPSNGPI